MTRFLRSMLPALAVALVADLGGETQVPGPGDPSASGRFGSATIFDLTLS